MREKQKPEDRLGFARNLLLASWLFSCLVPGLLVLDSTLRPTFPEKSVRGLVKCLSLSNLSLLPPGRPERNPQALHEAVDLRFSPLLPQVETEPVRLLIPGPETSVDRFVR